MPDWLIIALVIVLVGGLAVILLRAGRGRGGVGGDYASSGTDSGVTWNSTESSTPAADNFSGGGGDFGGGGASGGWDGGDGGDSGGGDSGGGDSGGGDSGGGDGGGSSD